MQPRTIRNIHGILRAALGFAVKWGWIVRNLAEHASPPKLTPSEINPPDPEQAARLVDAAWEADPDLGVFVWLAMTTGARRAELCVLRWSGGGPASDGEATAARTATGTGAFAVAGRRLLGTVKTRNSGGRRRLSRETRRRLTAVVR